MDDLLPPVLSDNLGGLLGLVLRQPLPGVLREVRQGPLFRIGALADALLPLGLGERGLALFFLFDLGEKLLLEGPRVGDPGILLLLAREPSLLGKLEEKV